MLITPTLITFEIKSIKQSRFYNFRNHVGVMPESIDEKKNTNYNNVIINIVTSPHKERVPITDNKENLYSNNDNNHGN